MNFLIFGMFLKEEKKNLKPLTTNNSSIQLRQIPESTKSAKPTPSSQQAVPSAKQDKDIQVEEKTTKISYKPPSVSFFILTLKKFKI